MPSSFLYYAESNIICVIIFSILLFHDIFSVDRQEKQIKFDHALIGFIVYFLADSVWAAIFEGLIPSTKAVHVIINFVMFVLLSSITFLWLRYVMAVQQQPDREKPLYKFLVSLPFLISTLLMGIIYLINDSLLFDEKFKVTTLFNIITVIVPGIYICTGLVNSLRRARHTEDHVEKVNYIIIGLFPFFVLTGGIFQVVFPHFPIFCFFCSFLMILFYIRSMDTQISTDPLTKLNNRGELIRFISQSSNLHIENRRTFFIMFDINDFKMINDTYGHAEGDRALTIVARAMMETLKSQDLSSFCYRYGGDEFVVILFAYRNTEVENIISSIRSNIEKECKAANVPYIVSIGAGFDELGKESDTVQKCMGRADDKLYKDKEMMKMSRR